MRPNVVAALIVAVALVGMAARTQAQVFDPAFNAAANGPVHAVALQADGKIVIGGAFTQVNGVARARLARLNADGSLDTGFTTTVTSGLNVYGLAVQPDGKILVGGWFTELAGVSRTNVARLLPDGSLDPGFTPVVQGALNQAYLVRQILVEPDGRILIAGNIYNVNGQARSNIARLNTDGTLDGVFAPQPNWHVQGVTRQPDGRILIAGNFTTVNGVARTGLARLNAGGSLDTTFAPTFEGAVTGPVTVTTVRNDGRILVGGTFYTVNGTPRSLLAQLNADGSLDPSFDVSVIGEHPVYGPRVLAIALQPDDRLLLAGNFQRVGSIYSYFVARLLADQAYDFSFGSVQGNWGYQHVSQMILQPDGKVIVGGEFGLTNIARLLPESPTPVNGDLRLTATAAPEPVASGGTLVYTLSVTNVGTHPVSAITLTDTLPAGLTFSSCTAAGGGTCSGSGNARTITFPALDVGGSVNATIIASVTAAGGATIVNTASVSALTPDLVSSNNTVSVTSHTPAPPTADLQLTMTASPEPVANDATITYTLTVRNNGTLAASSVTVADTLPAGVTFQACVASGGTCGGAGNARTVTYASIGAGVTRTIFLTATVHAGPNATLVNGATVSSATADAVPGNNSASVTSHTPPAPPSPSDTDGDGLPNDWEQQFGLDPGSASGDNGAGGDPDGDGSDNATEHDQGTHPRGFAVRYLAEGAVNSFFDVRLAVLNVGAAEGRLLFRYLQPGGDVLTRFRTLPVGQRLTLTRDELAGLSSQLFSTVVESDQPIILDRTMSWLGGIGSHAETGVPTPSTTWYLAEGSTSDFFSLFYLLQNPNPTPTTVTIRYLRAFGAAPVVKTYALDAYSRLTIEVDNEGPEVGNTDVSAVITAPLPIIVERAMYKSSPTQVFAAGHGATGVTATNTQWFLAEGATGPFFDCFILLANPNPQAASVTIDYLLLDGTVLTKAYVVPAEGRVTIWVDDEQLPEGSGVRPLDNVAVSASVVSSVPIVVERTMWWPSPAMSSDFWTEAHNSPGATTTGTKWALAEGEVGGPDGADTYILIANTSATPGTARVTLYFEDGTSTAATFNLLARSRLSVNAGVDFPAARGRRFGAVIESLGSPAAQIVVERAMYTSPNGAVWTAGTNALATKLQ